MKQSKDLLETARRVSARSVVLTSEVGVGQRHAFVDVITASWTLPTARALAEVAVVLVDAGTTVTTRVALTFVDGEQLENIKQKTE
jgi:hypothetical protein